VNDKNPEKVTLWQRIRRRGVMRVAISYLVIAWLVLQIGDVVLDPLGAPAWTMRLLIAVAAVGLPVALVLAWFLEFTPSGIEVDHLDEAATRPRVRGIRHYADVVIIGALLVVVAFLLLRQEGLIPEETAPTVVAIRGQSLWRRLR
jgi:membrane protease YdiL (CAAX protease family)